MARELSPLSSFIWSGPVLVASILLGAHCSSEHRPAPTALEPGPSGTDDDASHVEEAGASAGDACSSPGHVGCSCDEAGAVVECGKITQKAGEYITCSMGHSTCRDGTWSECVGDRIVIRSQPQSTGPLARRALATTVPCSNVCDPYLCRESIADPQELDAGGLPLTVTDAGVTLVPSEGGTGGGGPCKGLWCQVSSCDGGTKTSLSGVVYDPAGKVPLYNAYVYVPIDNSDLPEFPSGASCDTCSGVSLPAIAVAQTGFDGRFTLNNVPAGANVPLVVQMGKWRRRVILPNVTACTSNTVASDDSRLPRNRFDGYGNKADIPKIAIASGSADPFECLLLKAGIDASEIDMPDKGTRIAYYVYNGVDRSPGGAPSGATLTGSVDTLKQYDVVLLPCEGSEISTRNSHAPNLVTYTAVGGRVFTTHYGYVWLATPTNGIAANNTVFYGTAAWNLYSYNNNNVDFNDPMTGYLDQTFPKGAAFGQWLKYVGASTTLGQMRIIEPRHDATRVLGASQRWMYGKSAYSSSYDMLLSMTFNTPIGATPENQCGRVVFSDFHVSAAAQVSSSYCANDSQCGFGATCLGATVGTCAPSLCSSSWDCPSGWSCSGGTQGTCKARACSTSQPCYRGTCTSGVCKCSRDSHCGSYDCRTSGCAASSCYSDSDCGSSEYCDGGSASVCRKSCTRDADCGSTLCVSGQCTGCVSSSYCPSRRCIGGQTTHCSQIDMFPYKCLRGDLSAQEKALEFMLFDLTACVSPDNYTPPAPVSEFYSTTFTQDYVANCSQEDGGLGKHVVWREFDWQATIPATASIDFVAQTAESTADLASARAVSLATSTSSTVVPNWDVAVLDGVTAGAFATASPRIASGNLLRISITLNPTTTKKAAPTLMKWKVQYDCVDAE